MPSTSGGFKLDLNDVKRVGKTAGWVSLAAGLTYLVETGLPSLSGSTSITVVLVPVLSVLLQGLTLWIKNNQK